jgi:hypothetical protein
MFRYFRLFVMLFISCATADLSAQTLHYEVVRGDKNLGSMQANRIRNGDQQTFFIESEVSFKILFSFTVNYEQEEIFLGDTLISGYGYNTLNGSKQKETRLTKESDSYLMTFDGVNNRLHKNQIVKSMSQIHFMEPTDGMSYFSQHFGQFVDFKKTGEHTYLMVSPDGENHYTYENGFCKEIKVSRDYATFYFKMKPETLARVKNRTDSLFHK